MLTNNSPTEHSSSAQQASTILSEHEKDIEKINDLTTVLEELEKSLADMKYEAIKKYKPKKNLPLKTINQKKDQQFSSRTVEVEIHLKNNTIKANDVSNVNKLEKNINAKRKKGSTLSRNNTKNGKIEISEQSDRKKSSKISTNHLKKGKTSTNKSAKTLLNEDKKNEKVISANKFKKSKISAFPYTCKFLFRTQIFMNCPGNSS